MEPLEAAAAECAGLRARLDEANETLSALRHGRADALVGARGVISLEGAEKPYQVFFEAMTEGGLTLDAAGRILHANGRLADLLGVTIEGLRGGLLLDWVATGDRFRLAALLASRTRSRAEVCLLFRRQAQVPVLLSLTPLELDGRVVLCLVVSDRREHVAIEAERLESESFNRAILDSVGSEIAVLALDGTIIAVNEPWQAFALANGGPDGPAARASGVGVNYLQVCQRSKGATAREALEGIRAVLERRQPGFVLEYPCHTPEQERWFSMSVTPLGRGDQGVVVAHTDISKLRSATTERTNLQDQLQQAQKMESLGLLAGGIAHDMNNVLAIILGQASLNRRTQPEGPAAHAYDTIVKAATRGGTMVRGLLDFARKRPAEERELDLNRILREEAELLERTTLAKVRIQLDLEADLRPIRGDPGALANIVMNLCINAVDAMAKDGLLLLRTRNVSGDWVEAQIQDSGEGMTREVLEKAILPFFTTKGQGKGTGLGLSMAYSTMQAHGGQLQIQSEPGQGTCVSLGFPACVAEPVAAESAPDSGAVAAMPSQAVLLIDDDELVRGTTQQLLEHLGHRVSTAQTGEEALAMVEAGLRPDVVILDMNMPGIGGLGTLPRLRALCPRVPVLLASGRIDQEALDLVAADPKVMLLAKPFSLEELQSRLQWALGLG